MRSAPRGAGAGLAFRVALGLASLTLAGELSAQEADPPVGETPPAVSSADSSAGETVFPRLDFYFPEGELDFRLSRLIKGSFYEGQLRYDFLSGDIEAFLRYRYYGYDSVYQIGLFDAVEFDPIDRGTNDFERTRGGLLLIQHPFSYHQRAFFLVEFDRITSSKEEFSLTTNKTDAFVRIGHQIGTAADVGLNSVVGESRAERTELLTAHRELGPFGFGLSTALSYGAEWVGDFDYIKLEVASLKRFDLGPEAFAIWRVNGGSFLRKGDLDLQAPPGSTDRYAVPRGVFFKLDGRDGLKGLDDPLRGTDELLTTFEFFLPWFVDESRQALKAEWSSWYWILYAGYGAIGFDSEVLSQSENYITDAGFGFETSFRVKDYTVFMGGIVAQALDTDGSVKGRFSIRARH